MKKISILMFFLGLLFCNSVFAQSLVGQWKFQTTEKSTVSEVSYFGPNNYMIVGMNTTTAQSYIVQGLYSVSDDIITFQPIGGQNFSAKITWINQNKFLLSIGENGSFYNRVSSSYSVPNMPSTYTPSAPNNSTQPCWCCNGTGRCNVCSGKGKIGDNNCPDCFGSGICKHCSGTGIFKSN